MQKSRLYLEYIVFRQKKKYLKSILDFLIYQGFLLPLKFDFLSMAAQLYTENTEISQILPKCYANFNEVYSSVPQHSPLNILLFLQRNIQKISYYAYFVVFSLTFPISYFSLLKCYSYSSSKIILPIYLKFRALAILSFSICDSLQFQGGKKRKKDVSIIKQSCLFVLDPAFPVT